MTQIVFGTSDPAKVAQIQSVLVPRGIEIVGLSGQKVEVVEDGKIAGENARKKALVYAAALSCPVLWMA